MRIPMRNIRLCQLLLCIAFGFCLTPLLAQQEQYFFKNYGKNDGLVQDSPYDFWDTTDGYMWIAGENGLWKFNGLDFVHYKHQKRDSTSLANDFVWVLFEDSNEQLWAGTYGGGLSMYDKATNSFVNYKHDADDSSSISDNHVRGIAEDRSGNIWVGTNNGLSVLNPSTGKFKRYYVKDGLPTNTIRMLELSHDGKHLVAATINGLLIYDFEQKEFRTIQAKDNTKEGVSSQYIYAIHENPASHWWIGTGAGLDHLYLPTGEIKHFVHDKHDSSTISHDVVFCIDSHRFDDQKLLLSTLDGLNIFDKRTGTFQRIYADPMRLGALKGNNMYAVRSTRDGSIWVAVNNVGVFQHHPLFQKFNNTRMMPPSTEKYLSRVTDIIRHSDDEYIITTYSGLFVYNIRTKKKKRYAIKEGDQSSVNRLAKITRISDNVYRIAVWGHFMYEWHHDKRLLIPLFDTVSRISPTFNLAIHHDSKGRTWLGNSELGLFMWDDNKKLIRPITVDSDKNLLFISYIFEDSRKRIWVASLSGLYLLDDQQMTFRGFFHDDDNENSLVHDRINHIFEDSKGLLWISTEAGLSKFNPDTEEFVNLYTEDGLPNNIVAASLEDHNGDMWVSTVEGIGHIRRDGSFRHYDKKDGLLDETFIYRSAYQSDNGLLFFGSMSGLEYFDPEELPTNETAPIVRITDIELFNKTVKPQDESKLLNKSIELTRQITLNHEQSVITFKYNAFNLINAEKNRYQFILEGYDEVWRPITKERSTTYTNLPPGKYTFRVKGSNDEGVWNEEGVQLGIAVLPPWYRLWWVELAFGLFAAGSVIAVVWGRIRRVKKSNVRLEALVNLRTAELKNQKEEIEAQNEELNFRNSQVEMLMKELNHRVKNNLQLVSSILNLQSNSVNDINAKIALKEGRLRMQALSLLHQKMYYHQSYTELNVKDYFSELLDNLSIAFEGKFKRVNITIDIAYFILDIDHAIPLGLIANELVTNSFKHVPEEDLILFFSLKQLDGTVEMKVKDNGKGLSDVVLSAPSSFGMTMVNALTEQLNGTIEINRHNEIRITFASEVDEVESKA